MMETNALNSKPFLVKHASPNGKAIEFGKAASKRKTAKRQSQFLLLTKIRTLS